MSQTDAAERQSVAYDENIINQVQELMRSRRWSMADLADHISYSRAQISKYLDRQLDNPQFVENALASLLVTERRVGAEHLFTWTTFARAIVMGCDYALNYREIVPICARAGLGKTVAVRQFLAQQVRNSEGKHAFLWITATPHMSPSELLKEMLQRLHVPVRGSSQEMLVRVTAELQRRQYLLIIDEVNRLNYKALEDLRHIHDVAACGLVLISTKDLMDRLLNRAGRNGQDLEQFHSRIGLRPILLPTLTKKDLQAVARAKVADLSETAMEILLRGNRTPRVIHKILGRAEFLKRHNPGVRFEKLVEEAEREIWEAA